MSDQPAPMGKPTSTTMARVMSYVALIFALLALGMQIAHALHQRVLVPVHGVTIEMAPGQPEGEGCPWRRDIRQTPNDRDI